MSKKSLYVFALFCLGLFITSIVLESCHRRNAFYCNSYGWMSGRKGKKKTRAKFGGGNSYSSTTGWSYGLDNNESAQPADSLGGESLTELTLNMSHIPNVAQSFERYNPFEENEWIKTEEEKTSTFSIDVDQASYTNFRRYINQKQLPPKDAIRIEEWVNFFNYDLEAPDENDEHPLKITSEIAACPWEAEDELIMIKMQGKMPPVHEDLPPSNIVFLVDVSGSMSSEDKLGLVKKSMIKLVDQLRPQDNISIVTYAGNWSTPLKPTSGDQKDVILKAIDGMSAGGSTGGSKGVNAAYDLAAKNFDPNGNNRVIVATDGDWNVGITDDEELKKLIEEKRETGIYLSLLGFGMGNLNDQMMEILSNHGNGNYAYIDSEQEADRVFNTEFAGSMYTIAKDVKLQLEFDPNVVESYRLLGYENRVLENWMFEEDSIDAGDLGMGQNVVAFYQVKRKRGSNGSVGKLDFRYKPLDSDVSTLLSHEFGEKLDEPSSDFNFASCVIEFAMCLRESEYRGTATMENAIMRGKRNLGDENDKVSYDKRVEFVGTLSKTEPMYTEYVTEKAPDIDEPMLDGLKLYPNPASEFTNIEVPDKIKEAWSIQLFGMNGALHQVQHFQDVKTGRIELIDLPPGTYIIKVYSGGFSFGYLRLVKQ